MAAFFIRSKEVFKAYFSFISQFIFATSFTILKAPGFWKLQEEMGKGF